jgi:hypothetical protein
MTSREFQKFAVARIAPYFPDAKPVRRTFAAVPVGPHFTGFYCQPTDAKEYFVLHAVVHPLYRSYDDARLTYSKQLGATLTADVPEELVERLVTEGIAFIHRLDDPGRLAAYAIENANDPSMLEDAASALAYAGERDRARSLLEDLVAGERESPDPYWPDMSRERVRRGERLLEAMDSNEERELLSLWIAESAQALGVSEDMLRTR